MKNWIRKGDTLEFVAPTGGVTSGTGYLIGGVFVVAAVSAAAGADFEGMLVGEVNLPKATGQAWVRGDIVYWDNAAKNVTKTSTSNTKIGIASSVQASGDTAGNVRLNGTV